MTELRLYASRSGLDEATPWALLDSNGRVQLEGHGLATVPAADCVLVVVPDECISVISLALPDLPPKRLQQALPTIIEDHLLTPADSTDAVLVAPPASGTGTVAAFSRDWLNSMLSAAPILRCPMVRVVAESWALSRQDSALSVYAGIDHIIYAMSDWAATTELATSGPAKPEAVLFALRQAFSNEPRPDRIVFFSSPSSAALAPAWLNEFDVPVESGGVFDWRTASYKTAPNLHVRQRKKFPFAALMEALRPGAIILGAFVALEICATTFAWGRLSFENSTLKAQQAEMFRAVMGPDATLVDGERQLMHRLAGARIASGQAEAADLLVLMSRIAAGNSSAPALDEIRFESGALTLQLKNREDEAAWLMLAKSGGLTAVTENRDGKNLVRVAP
jgi:type II secretion system protein L